MNRYIKELEELKEVLAVIEKVGDTLSLMEELNQENSLLSQQVDSLMIQNRKLIEQNKTLKQQNQQLLKSKEE